MITDYYLLHKYLGYCLTSSTQQVRREPDDRLQHAKPDYDDFVIVRALRSVSLDLPELSDDPSDFEDGSITALPYRVIEAYVIDKTFELV